VNLKNQSLGKGSFGNVQLANYLGTDVAVKIIIENDPSMKKFIYRELDLMRSLRHPCIVQFIGSYEDENKLHLGMKERHIVQEIICEVGNFGF
jgi:serine/threonine protein kinase